jgi:hypothetical protein
MTDPICEVDEPYRSACQGQACYGDYKGKRYCILHYPSMEKVADADKPFQDAVRGKLEKQDFNFAGVYFPEYLEDFASITIDSKADVSNAAFKGGVAFNKAVFGEYADFSNAKFIGNTSFSAARFEKTANFRQANARRSVSFSEATFHKEAIFTEANLGTFAANVSFEKATFCQPTSFNNVRFGRQTSFDNATFAKQVQFQNAVFRRDATFRWATFKEDARFEEAHFRRHTDFARASFEGEALFILAIFGGMASFLTATFGEDTSFSGATFEGDVYFRETNFRDRVIYLGTEVNRMFNPQAIVDFRFARAERPELVSFQTVTLRPSWMVGFDTRYCSLTDVSWYGLSRGDKGAFQHELEALHYRGLQAHHGLLAKTCRELYANYEDRRDYPLANEFHYWSMEALRKEGWKRLGLIRTLYWALSGPPTRNVNSNTAIPGSNSNNGRAIAPPMPNPIPAKRTNLIALVALMNTALTDASTAP